MPRPKAAKPKSSTNNSILFCGGFLFLPTQNVWCVVFVVGFWAQASVVFFVPLPTQEWQPQPSMSALAGIVLAEAGRCAEAGGLQPEGCAVGLPPKAKRNKCAKDLPPSAKRNKYDKQGSVDFEITDRPCLTGRHLKQPHCLPSQVFENTSFLRVGTREPWIHMTLSGRVRCCDLSAAILSVKRNIKSQILAESAAAKKEEDEGVIVAASTGRIALGLDDDSSATDSDSSRAKRAPKLRRHKVIPRGAKNITLLVQGVQMKTILHNRNLWVECEAKCVKAFVAEVEVHLIPKALRDAALKAAEASKAESPIGDGAGRVRFSSAHECLMLRYIDKTGRVRQHSKGLRVPTRTLFGAIVPVEEYSRTLREKLIDAKRMWNKLDQSDRERYNDV